jgi:hypothetical protein
MVIALGLATLGVSGSAFAQKAPPPPVPKVAASDDLSLLPVDSELVGGLDFAQLQTSMLWKQYVGPLLQSGDVQAQMAEFKATCNVDPMQVVTRISFGIKGIKQGGGGNPDGVIVAHGVPKAKLVACFGKYTAGKKKLGKDVTVDGDVLITKDKDSGQSVAFSFFDENTALIVVGKQATKAGIKLIAKGQSALKTSPAFVDFYKKTNTSDTLWVLMNGNSPIFAQLAAMGIKPKAVFGSINVTKDIALDLRMRLPTADEAKKLASTVQPQVTQAAAMFDKLVVTNDGSDVRVQIGLSDAKLKALMMQLAPMMGGGGGGSKP